MTRPPGQPYISPAPAVAMQFIDEATIHVKAGAGGNGSAAMRREDNVPREAVTMGIATILAAREIAILATGEHKSGIVRRAVEGEIDRAVAATFLQRHPNTTFFLDEPQ